MAEVSEALRKKMLSLFKTKRETDSQIAAFRRKLDAKKATQTDVSDYSARLGELARDTIREVLTPEELPNETLYFNILMDTVDPLMRSAHALVNRTAAEVQKIIDEANGLGLNEVDAPYPQRRVRDLLFKAGDPAADYESKMRLLNEPIVTLTQAFYDDHVRVNAEERFRAGMAPKIVRRASLKCCDWCAALDGTYDYGDVSNTGNDVFRRHERCRCTVEYVCDGQRQDVWSKKMYAADEETLSSRDTYHTSTGDTSPDTLQMRSEYGKKAKNHAAMAYETDKNPWPKPGQPIQGKALSDLKRYAAEKGIKLRFFESFDGDPSMVCDMIDAMSRVAQDYPAVFKVSKEGLQIINDPTINSDDFAIIAGRTGIRINTAAFRSRSTLQEVYDQGVKDKLFFPGNALENIVHHEMGHIVSKTYYASCRDAVKGVNRKKISGYAMKNASEGVAEAFSDVYSGRNTEEALTIKNRYDSLIKEGGGLK